MRNGRRLLVFTKPARPGRVKTRLIGDLTPDQAAELHAAFVGDLLERLRDGAYSIALAWALDDGEEVPAGPCPGFRQEGGDLGERLFRGLARAAATHRFVAAVGSDHPRLSPVRVEEAFSRLEAGAEVVLGPAADGGYYLVALDAEKLEPGLFAAVPWSTERVFSATLARCRERGLAVELLAEHGDVDTPADLRRLGDELAREPDACPRTRRLLAAWGRLPARAAG